MFDNLQMSGDDVVAETATSDPDICVFRCDPERPDTCTLLRHGGAKRLEELIIWQLACELREGIAFAVSHGSAKSDWDFRNQIERSSRSIAANISEGYGHVRPRQFAKYLRIARASTLETRNHILEGKKKHFSSGDSARFLRLCKRLVPGISRLTNYLDSCPQDLDLRPNASSHHEPLNP